MVYLCYRGKPRGRCLFLLRRIYLKGKDALLYHRCKPFDNLICRDSLMATTFLVNYFLEDNFPKNIDWVFEL